MTQEDKSRFLIETRSNVHYENNERVLELSMDGLLDLFEVTDVILK